MAKLNGHADPRPPHNYGHDVFYILIIAAIVGFGGMREGAAEQKYVKDMMRKDSVISLRDSTIGVLFPKAGIYDSEQVRVQKAKDHIKELVEKKSNQQNRNK